MKHYQLILAAAFFGSILTSSAQLTIPSDGSDGAFNPSANVEIDLGLATTALWNSPGSGNGVYDAEKWAVVFKYSSVNIPTGVKVTFKNHPTYAPVVWLVQGSVNISGTLNLDGKPGTSDNTARLIPTEPGPGGFRGGATSIAGYGGGMGPGGGAASWNTAFGNLARYNGVYSNPQILPLVGGSGNGGNTDAGTSGQSGAGALAIFSGNNVSIFGSITAKSAPRLGSGGFGSGGAVRIVAPGVGGTGQIQCANDASNPGRIRIETNSLAASVITTPETAAVQPSNPPVLWPAANAPTARVVSVDAVNAPLDPRAPLVAAADVAIQNSGQVNILIETKNFPIEGVVQLFIIPKFAGRSILTATRLSGDITSAIWRVQTTLPQGFVTLQARATQP